ncbi:MAG: GNAT family N-acetyltransferase [Lachnospiraceae bacterium]
MIKGKYLYGTADYSEVAAIRKKVFIEEQGIDPELEMDGYDEEAIFALVYDEQNHPIGCGRLILDHYDYKIGRIAVLKEYRGQHYGDFIVRMLLDKAFSCGAPFVKVGSQAHATRFYEKIGFVPTGEGYMEAGIMHLPMTITEEQFRTSTPCHSCDGGCHE